MLDSDRATSQPEETEPIVAAAINLVNLQESVWRACCRAGFREGVYVPAAQQGAQEGSEGGLPTQSMEDQSGGATVDISASALAD